MLFSKMSHLHDFSGEQFQFIKLIILIQFNAERKSQLQNQHHRDDNVSDTSEISTCTYWDADHTASPVIPVSELAWKTSQNPVSWPVCLLIRAYSWHSLFLSSSRKWYNLGAVRSYGMSFGKWKMRVI